MKNIPAPFGDHYDEFKELVERKQNGEAKNILKGLYGKIRIRYSEYGDNKTETENVVEVVRSAKEKAALDSCYSNSVKLKEELLHDEAEQNIKRTPRCPYCQLDRATTWDHFLPSSKYPDFFVLRQNLIHVCHHCNEIKGNRFITPARKVINPYYDDLTGVPYLKCVISSEGELTATYMIDPDTASPTYSPYIHEITKSHFEKFKLEEKLRAEACSKLSGFKSEVKAWRNLTEIVPTIVQINNILDLKLKDLHNMGEGPNNWEVSLWTNLKSYPKLLNTIQQWFLNE